MKSEVSEIGPCKFSLKIEVEVEKVKQTVEGKYKALADQVALPGFRPGHAPRALLVKKFGKSVLDESKTDLISGSYEEALKEKELTPLGEPEIDFEKIAFAADAPLSFEVTVEVRPKFDLPPYTGIEVEKPKYEVTAEEIDRGLLRLRESRAQIMPAADGVVQPDDYVVADQELIVEGETKSKEENANFTVTKDLVLFGQPRPDVVDRLVGAKAGVVEEFALTLPENIEDKSLAGKTATLRITLRDVKRKVLPDVDAAWLKELDFDTVDELKEEIKKRIDRQKAQHAEEEVEEAILTKIVDAATFPLPEGIVAKSAEDVLNRERVKAQRAGVPEAEIERLVEEGRKGSKEATARTLKAMLLIDAIATKEKIFVTETEVDERLATLAQGYGKWPHEMRQFYEEHGLLSQLRSTMREEKVRTFLRKKAVVKE